MTTSFLGLGGFRGLSRIAAGLSEGTMGRSLHRQMTICSLGIAICVPWLLLGAHAWQSGSLTAGLSVLYNCLTFRTVARIKIGADHYLYDALLAFMARQESRHCAQRLTLERRMGEQNQDIDSGSSNTRSRQLEYSPDVGTYPLVFEGHSMTLERRRWTTASIHSRDLGVMTYRRGAIVVSHASYSGTTKPIKAFLNSLATKEESTAIWRPHRRTDNSTCWQRTTGRPHGSLSKIALEGDLRESILRTINTYLNSGNQEFHGNRGIPWHLAMLFHGPHGTGKTSLCTALARHLGFDIYIVSLADAIDDHELAALSGMTKDRRCVFLIEDVDESGNRPDITQRRLSTSSGSNGTPDAARRRITTPGLLSIINGVNRKEGRVLVLTATNLAAVDAALLHPVRIDHRFYFDYATTAVMGEIFKHMFVRSSAETVNDEDDGFNVDDIERLAHEFSFKLPNRALTAAEIQSFLLSHRESPVAAVRDALPHFTPIAQARNYAMRVAFRNQGRHATVASETSQDREEEARWFDHSNDEGGAEFFEETHRMAGTHATTEGSEDGGTSRVPRPY
nr:putative mitochondrial chaperone bcs1-a [Quercus suber]